MLLVAGASFHSCPGSCPCRTAPALLFPAGIDSPWRALLPVLPCSLGGKASFCAGSYEAALSAYQKAVELDAQALAAWEGIAEVEVAEGHQAKAVESYRRLVRGSESAGISLHHQNPLHGLLEYVSHSCNLVQCGDALSACCQVQEMGTHVSVGLCD